MTDKLTQCFILLSLLISLSNLSKAQAQPTAFIGIGYDYSKQDARALAYNNLIKQVEIKSNARYCQRHNKKGQQLPCYGTAPLTQTVVDDISFSSLSTKQGKFGFRAEIDKTAIVSKYLPLANQQARQLNKALTSANENPTPKQLSKIWRLHQSFAHSIRLLDAFDIAHALDLSGSATTVLKLQYERAKTLTGLNELPAALLSLGPIQDAYLHAPNPKGSVEMTPFSEQVRRKTEAYLAAQFPFKDIAVRGLKKSAKPENTCLHNYTNIQIQCQQLNGAASDAAKLERKLALTGFYEYSSSPYVNIYFELINLDEGPVNHAFYKLPKSALTGIRFKPLNLKFDQLLYENIESKGSFQVDLKTSRGKQNILIYGGEEIELAMQVNKPAYYYLVGHVVRPNIQFSYLLELDSKTNKFVQHVPDTMTNQWLSLGKFEVEPPFGVEHVQLVAANYDLTDKIPRFTWHSELGYFVLDGSLKNAMNGLNQVRGMQRLCSSATRGLQRNCGTQVIISEAVPNQTAPPQTEKTQTELAQTTSSNEQEHEAVISFSSIETKN